MATLTQTIVRTRKITDWTLVVTEVDPPRTFELTIDETAQSRDPIDQGARNTAVIAETTGGARRAIASAQTARTVDTLSRAQAFRLLEQVVEGYLEVDITLVV